MQMITKEIKSPMFVSKDKLVELRKEQIKLSFYNFEFEPHRLDFVARIKNVDYVNDSKATNINASWYSLEKINKSIIWIIGTRVLVNDLNTLKNLIHDKVSEILYVGATNYMLENYFLNQNKKITNIGSILDAVKISYRISRYGDTVLFSPACPSFDLYNNYEERGDDFIKAVRNL